MSNEQFKDLISVMIPVYNVKPYLEKCLESVLAQDCGVMQIVIADDGSTDGSAEMIDAYAQKYPRTDGTSTWVEVYHIPNGVAADSRNEALKHIEGRFVISADSDDFVPQGAFKGLRDALLENDVAMAVGQYRIVNETDHTSRMGAVGPCGVYDAKVVKQTIAYEDELMGGGYLWCRMMDRTKLEYLPTFAKGIILYEDKIWLMKLLNQVDQVCVTDVVAYEYYVRNQSSSWGNWRSFDRTHGWNIIADDMIESGLVTERFVHEYIYNYMGQFLRLTDYAEQVPAWDSFVEMLQRLGVMDDGKNHCYADVYTDLLWMIHKRYRLNFLRIWPTYRRMKLLGNLSLKRYIKCFLLHVYKVCDHKKELREQKRSDASKSRRAFKKHGPLCTEAREAQIAKNKQLHHEQKRPMRVAFIAQFPETWTSVQSVYEAAVKAGAETLLLCIPKPMNNGDLEYRIEKDYQNDAYTYFRDRGIDAVDAYEGCTWFDLEAYGPDYVFYTRPYNHHYPKCYINHTVKEYARVCYVPYAYSLMVSEVFDGIVNYDFMSSTDFTFHTNDLAREKTIAHLPVQAKRGGHHFESFGYPRFDVLQQRLEEFHKEERDGITIAWLPRWLFADIPNQKKSHFLDYYENLKQYMRAHPQDRLIIRPHPLMWESMVDAGVRTKEEMLAIRKEIEEAPNMELDQSGDYIPTLLQADVLFADYTALIVEYLITGRPIIYTDDQENFDETAKKIASGFVTVNNWEETEAALESIQRGEDVLLEKRRAIWKEITPNEAGTIGANIVQHLVNDYER